MEAALRVEGPDGREPFQGGGELFENRALGCRLPPLHLPAGDDVAKPHKPEEGSKRQEERQDERYSPGDENQAVQDLKPGLKNVEGGGREEIVL